MKATSLIIKLVKLVAENGDLDVVCSRGGVDELLEEDPIYQIGIHEKDQSKIICLDNKE